MKYLRRRRTTRLCLTFLAITGLVACDAASNPARPFNDPAVQALYMKSTPEYYGTVSLAKRVAQSCPDYRFDQAQDDALNAKRNAEGRGSVAAQNQRGAIDVNSDVIKRGFQAKYDVIVGQDNLCNSADMEYPQNTALAALLVPVR